MPRLQCLCGEEINLSPIPNLQGFAIYWEPWVDMLIDRLLSTYEKGRSLTDIEKSVNELLIKRKPNPCIYECASCGHLALFANASDSEVRMWYAPQNDAKQKTPLIQELFVKSKTTVS